MSACNLEMPPVLLLRMLHAMLCASIAVLHCSHAKTCAVACSSRKGTVDTATHLLSVINKNGRGYVKDHTQHNRLQHAAATTGNRQLQQCMQAGIAFHNAGMEAEERTKVEQLFMQRAVLVSK